MDTANCHPHSCKRISWSAVLAGALTAVGLGFLLNLLAIALGLNAFTFGNVGISIAIGGLVGLVILVIITMFIAGFVAGCLGSHYVPRRNLGIVYGFITWTLALLLTAAFALQLSQYVMAYTAGVTHSVMVNMPNQQNANQANMATSTKSAKNNTAKVADESAAKTPMTWGAFIIFGLFLVGAIASCCGAACGMRAKHED